MQQQQPRNKHLLLGLTGSVATIKAVPLVNLLKETLPDYDVQVVATEHARHFLSEPFHEDVKVWLDEDEWKLWKKRGDPVLHIDLRNWADMIVIAPLDANTLAKLANGICDNLLTSIMRAWDISKDVLLCPAMNTHMWQHPMTEQHLNSLKQLRYNVLPPISKVLMCGVGGMAEIETIVKWVLQNIKTS